MTTDWMRVELLGRELKGLIGYGAKPHHVITRPVLRELVASRHPSLDASALKQAILAELRSTADDLPGEEAEAVRELLVLSKAYAYKDARRRREDVICRLNLACSVETFRRPDGPEMERMRDFAQVLLQRLEG